MTDSALLHARAIGTRYPGTVVAIGKFEGVHRGHQRILEELSTIAQNEELGAVVVTFENNPLSVLKPEVCPDPLMSPEQRREALRARGIEEVLMIPFTKELASITAEDFIDTYLVTGLKAKHVIVGDDFRFGRGAKGTPELLAKEGKAKGFSVDVIDEVQDSQAGRVSSTLIREALKDGDVQLAEALLGHAHKVRGQVVHGEARGRELGVPTANLGPLAGHDQIEGMVPKDGVYAGWARVRGKDYPTAISVGNNPTFTPHAKSQVEAHLLGFSGDLYGAEIEIAFKHRVRDMQKFNSIELLIERMQSDLKQVSELLSIS